MREDYPTEDEIRGNFEKLLRSVCEGGEVHSHSGVDRRTEDALWAIVRAYPHIPQELVIAARAAFDGQLDGSNAAAAEQTRLRKIEAAMRRRAAE